jgi:potassium-transporting ATPase KdpC subunit
MKTTQVIDTTTAYAGRGANPEALVRLETGARLAQLRPAAIMLALMVLLTGLAYPLAMTGIAATVFPRQATASLIERDGVVIGSALLAQGFAGPGYFHARPSAADYDAASSGASNLAPTNAELREAVQARAEAWRDLNGGEVAPIDAVTASGSGLDPHVSVANALGQVGRVAEARGTPAEAVRALVAASVEKPWLGLFGEPRVNVLLLNLALDDATPAAPSAPAEVPSE